MRRVRGPAAGSIGLWIKTWARWSVMLAAVGLVAGVGSLSILEETRPCWDFDPEGLDIQWPVESTPIERLDLTPDDRADVLRWIDSGCPRDGPGFVQVALTIIWVPSILMMLGSVAIAVFPATKAVRRSHASG